MAHQHFDSFASFQTSVSESPSSQTLQQSKDIHRKIALDSCDDIKLLESRFLSALEPFINDKIAAWKSNAQGVDPSKSDAEEKSLRKSIAKEIKKAVLEQFQTASPNILINGLDYSEAFRDDVEYEPFDEQIVAQIVSLKEQIINNINDVCVHQQRMGNLLNNAKAIKIHESTSEDFQSDLEAVDVGNDMMAFLDSMDFENVRAEYEDSVELIGKMNGYFPPTLEKLERAHKLMDHLGITSV
ncbi:hypothetical protein HK098_002156 [Nowakowskiella sp. JEL0407]|nr:hypothetical protein HK098_002156 [Nowakowskiella sp. JEL0407]